MLRWILIALGAFLLYKLFTGDKKVKDDKSKKQEEKLVASGEMVKDPICGSYVEKDSPIRVRSGENVHSFCSYECRDKYLKQLEAGKPDQEKAG
ncbi:MAG: transcriptional regulator [Thermodesulfobacteriota bacterium]